MTEHISYVIAAYAITAIVLFLVALFSLLKWKNSGRGDA